MSMALDTAPITGLPETEAHALEQYEKIIRFRDDILAGKHATIQPPTSSNGPASSKNPTPRTAPNAPNEKPQNFTSSVQYGVGSSSSATQAVPPIEPSAIILTEPERLLRAELQAQRRRIEQALQQDAKLPSQPKQGGLDTSAILAAALILVPELKLPEKTEEGEGGGNGAENDSFDDNTFYSSQHDTPEFEPASPVIPAAPEATAVAAEPTANIATTSSTAPTAQDQHRSFTQTRQLRTYEDIAEPAVKRRSNVVPGLSYVDNASAPSSTAKPVPTAQAVVPGPVPTQPSSYVDLHPPSPLLRGNETAPPLQPGQPLQVSGIPGLQGNASNFASHAGAPAQVAALRSEPGSRTSPESSSQGGQNKRKNRRKKRKSDRQALENQAIENNSRHIKAEPRSPSPISGPAYIRPTKRQRQSNGQAQTAPHDEMAYDPAMPGGPSENRENPQQQQHRQDRQPRGYESSATGTAAPAGTRISREYVAEPVMTDDGYRREYMPAVPMQYSARGSHLGRPVSQMVGLPDTYQDGALTYGNSAQTARYSVNPDGEAFHEASRPQPARILVDAYGREYIEPPRQIIRHSVAPSPLPGEPDRLYERAPTQAASRYPSGAALEERGYMYAQPPSPYNAPRRILTQPEYISFGNGDVRYREYSARPMGMPAEFVSVRPQEHRVYADGSRDYMGRASSMHPMEQTRIASDAGSYGQVPNVRPEASGFIYNVDRTPPVKSWGVWPMNNQGAVARDGGGYAAPAQNEAGSSRGAPGPDNGYVRGSRTDGFR